MGGLNSKDEPHQEPEQSQETQWEVTLRAMVRKVQAALRSIERERLTLEKSEKKVFRDMKTMAGNDSVENVQIIARELVQIRKQKKIILETRSKMQTINLRLQAVISAQTVAKSVQNVSQVIRRMDKSVDLSVLTHFSGVPIRDLQDIMSFETSTGKKTVGNAKSDEEEAEVEKLVSLVYDQVHSEIVDQLSAVPANEPGAGETKKVDSPNETKSTSTETRSEKKAETREATDCPQNGQGSDGLEFLKRNRLELSESFTQIFGSAGVSYFDSMMECVARGLAA